MIDPYLVPRMQQQGFGNISRGLQGLSQGMQQGMTLRQMAEATREKQRQRALQEKIKNIYAANTVKKPLAGPPDPTTGQPSRYEQDRRGILMDLQALGPEGLAVAQKQQNLWLQKDAAAQKLSGKGTKAKTRLEISDKGIPYQFVQEEGKNYAVPYEFKDLPEGAEKPSFTKKATEFTDEEGNRFIRPHGSQEVYPVKKAETGKPMKDPGVLAGIEKTKQDWAKIDLAKNPAPAAIDNAYAKHYTDYWVGGKYKDAEKNIGQLTSVIDAIEGGASPTGKLKGILPKVLKDLALPKDADMQEAVEEIVQRNLRLVLGAQFTEKEGERLISRAYNPRLPTEQNLTRLKRLLSQMQGNYQTQTKAKDYFEQNQSMRGFKINALIKSKAERGDILEEWESSYGAESEPKRRKATLEDF
jgi:hypothetical protein